MSECLDLLGPGQYAPTRIELAIATAVAWKGRSTVRGLLPDFGSMRRIDEGLTANEV